MNRSPAAFFALTFLLSVPFYVLNALAYVGVLGEPEIGALYVACFTVTPIASASILTFRRSGVRGLKLLLGRTVDFKRISGRRWYAAILLLPPLIFLMALGVLALTGAPLPPALTPLVALPAVLPFFFLLAVGEEVGWMGYAFEPMESRFGALWAALVLGVLWACWHLPFFVFLMPDPVVFSSEALRLLGARVLAAWIFNNTGKSVFATILFHAVDNTALVTLPELLAVTPWGPAMLCGLFGVAAVLVVAMWGPRTLATYRFGKTPSAATEA